MKIALGAAVILIPVFLLIVAQDRSTRHLPAGFRDAPGSAGSADCVLYKDLYGYDAVAHINNGVIYRDLYGYDAVGHIKGEVVYQGQYGHNAVAHISRGVIYRGQFGSDAVGNIRGNVIHRGQYEYDPIAHTSGCSTGDTYAAAGAALIFGLF